MIAADRKDDQEFVNLSEFQKVGNPKQRVLGNVIKGETIQMRGHRRITVEDSGPEAPKIVVHKEGERVESVEVVCSCGKSTSLRFDYDQETPPSV